VSLKWSQIAVLILSAVGCATPATPEPAPTKDDTSIPPELGPSDSLSVTRTSDLTSLVKSLRKFEGHLQFLDAWKVLAEPALRSSDFDDKRYFVRYVIPIRGISPEQFEGGTAGLLIAIFQSQQSFGVRTAAMLALTGAGEGADPSAVLASDSPGYESLMAQLLERPESPRRNEDLEILVYALTKHEAGSQGAPRRLIARALDSTRSPETLMALLRPLSFNWRYMKEDLRPALEAIVRDLKPNEDDPQVGRVLTWVKNNLDASLLSASQPEIK
jgi:hypothetical protein